VLPTENYAAEAENADPAQQPGHVEQNQNPEALVAAQNASPVEQWEAYTLDDPRYGSGPRPAPKDSK